MASGDAARDSTFRLTLRRHAALALGQEAIHQAVAIRLVVRVGQPDRMPHLVQDGRE